MFKTTEINFEDKSYSCEIRAENNESLIIKIHKDGIPNFEGKLALKEIYSQIPALDEYSMEEIFNILKELEKDKFEMVNNSANNQIQLKIMVKILKKTKELYINLVKLEPKSQSKEEIIQQLLSSALSHQKKLEILEKELKALREKLKANQIRKLDLKLRKTKKISNNSPFLIIALKDGRIAIGIEEWGIAIVDNEKFEILFEIKSPCSNFIELKNGKLALISVNKILIVKLETFYYFICQTIDIASFTALSQLWNGTLIGGTNGEIIFFKEEKNLYSKDFGIKINKFSKFILQTKTNEIAYTDFVKGNQIIFYDFANKAIKGCIKGIIIDTLDISNIGMINKELLFVISYGKKCNLIDVNNYKVVKSFTLDKMITSSYLIKGQSLIFCNDQYFERYEIGKDDITYEPGDIAVNMGCQYFVYLNKGKKTEIIGCDSYGNILQFY